MSDICLNKDLNNKHKNKRKTSFMFKEFKKLNNKSELAEIKEDINHHSQLELKINELKEIIETNSITLEKKFEEYFTELRDNLNKKEKITWKQFLFQMIKLSFWVAINFILVILFFFLCFIILFS